ncbi:MAG: TlpA family protein disulfide reductase [Polyangiaceae bacterium]|nr:TlpA family protein disulfide reductase [Polyangiaceae bacterium]
MTHVACTPVADEPLPETPKAPAPTGAMVHFSYSTLDGKELSTKTLAGRYSVLGFITTNDLHSHAQARFLSTVVKKHVPRINAGVIVLEPPQNKVLVEAFTKVVAPPYPVAMADDATIRGDGPFKDIREVPTVVILDQLGREVWRHRGLVSNDTIDAALNALRRGKTPP